MLSITGWTVGLRASIGSIGGSIEASKDRCARIDPIS
jgi:hypothetical protein